MVAYGTANLKQFEPTKQTKLESFLLCFVRAKTNRKILVDDESIQITNTLKYKMLNGKKFEIDHYGFTHIKLPDITFTINEGD